MCTVHVIPFMALPREYYYTGLGQRLLNLVTRVEGASLPQTRDYVAQGVRRSQGLEPPEHLEHANRS
jgi:hypothetical protein